ncbi:hypothetical protein V8E54_012248 [Elaphomyces granulatus]
MTKERPCGTISVSTVTPLKRYTSSKRDRDGSLSSWQAVLSGSNEDGVKHRMTAKAIFRALQGHWKFSRVLKGSSDLGLGNNEPSVSGAAFFHPRYPTDPHYESEYLYEENELEMKADRSIVFATRCNMVKLTLAYGQRP